MAHPVKTFRPSEHYVDYSARMCVLAGILLSGIGFLVSFVRADFDPSRVRFESLAFWAVVAAVTIIWFIHGAYSTRRRLKQTYKLILGAEELDLMSGSDRTVIAWQDIQKVVIRTDANGAAVMIDVQSAAGESVRLVGLDHMDDLATTIMESIPERASLETRRKGLNWSDPRAQLAPIAGGLAVVAVLEFARRYGGDGAFQVLCSSVFVCAGAYFLLKRPMAKADPSYAKWELVIGSIFLASGAFLLWALI